MTDVANFVSERSERTNVTVHVSPRSGDVRIGTPPTKEAAAS
jgi:hypothetical protein